MLHRPARWFCLPRCSFWTATLSLKSSLLLHAGGIASIVVIPTLWNFASPDEAAEMLGRSGVIVVQASMLQSAASDGTKELPPMEIVMEEVPAEESVPMPFPEVEAKVLETLKQDVAQAVAEKTDQTPLLEKAELVNVPVEQIAAERAEVASQEVPSETRVAEATTSKAATRQPAAPASLASVAVPPLTSGFDTMEKPSFANNVPPEYPVLAQQNGWHGTVLLRVVISEQGLVREVHVQTSSGHALLDDAAVRAVQTWRAQPARRGGRPVVTTEYLPVVFRPRI